MRFGRRTRGLRPPTKEGSLFGASLTWRVIEDVDAWDAIRVDWDRLYHASPTASAPLDFVWLRTWWEVYGPVYGSGGLRIVSIWRESRLVGALPLYLDVGRGTPFSVRCLRFISTGEAEFEETCPDYLNLLHVPDDEMACAQAAWAAVGAMQWDVLELLDLPDDTPLLRVRTAFPLRVLARGSCPVAFIGDGFEAYLTQLSSKSRMRARQEVRKAERSDTLFELAGATDSGQYFDELIRIHQERWVAGGQPGCFAAPRFTEFHRRLVHEWVAGGRAILGRLSHRASTFVVLYGFVTNRKFDLYQLGVASDERAIVHSPGMAANLLLMAELAARGVSHYDFLRGVSAFKKSLTTEQRTLICLACRRPTMRALLGQVRNLLARVCGKLARWASQGRSP